MLRLLWNWKAVAGAFVEMQEWPDTLVPVIGIVVLMMLILALIGRWKIFRKFGEPGWKSLIPYYGKWVEYGYTWNPKIILWDVAQVIVNEIMEFGAGVWEADSFLAAAAIAVIVFESCCLVVSVIAAYKLARAFGHGLGYAIGLILAPWLFQFILGCGSSLYNGPEGRWPRVQDQQAGDADCGTGSDIEIKE